MHSPETVATIFSPAAHYQDTPYFEPASDHDGLRSHWSRAVSEQRDVNEVLSVSLGQGVAHWSAVFRRTPDADMSEIDGVFLLQFNPQELCTDLKEWWHTREP